jgi:hydrogenase/urease accessory protein HupE
MPGLLGQADMLVRIAPQQGDPQALRLTGREPVAQIAVAPMGGQVLETYFVLGVEHILAGWDHLLFVIALVLLIGEWRRVVWAATAFTLAHSLTLAAASLGFVGVPQRPVEALIALSIVFLAIETLKADAQNPSLTARYPWVVAFLFGLLHGFGFAGALSAIGLPQDDIVAALLAFNIGVEAGQLLVVAVTLGTIAVLRRFALPAVSPVIRAASYAIGIIGAYWLLDRTVFASLA